MGARKRGGDAIARKADLKLDYVARLWCEALAPCCTMGETQMLERELVFSGVDELRKVTLRYEIRSKLFATLFDLVYAFETPGSLGDDAVVSLCRDGEGFSGEGDVEAIAEALSNALVLDRVRELGVTEVEACFSVESQLWHVRMKGLVGSSTWNLLPPVLQLIKPSCEDCIKSAEILRMLASACSMNARSPVFS